MNERTRTTSNRDNKNMGEKGGEEKKKAIPAQGEDTKRKMRRRGDIGHGS